MSFTFYTVVGVIAVCYILMKGVVEIIKVAKGSGKVANKKIDEFGTDLASLEQDLEDARQRIEVLEKIVTDEKYDLKKKIDDLAN
ncbi:MAG: hypothetical protein VB957_09345 [Pseudomonadales bacterium]